MTLPHITSGEIVNLKTLKADMPVDSTCALFKASEMEVIRMVLPEGKKIPEHRVAGKISIQCVSGHTKLSLGTKVQDLHEGDWLYIDGNELHALEAVAASVLLVTILLTAKA